MAKLWMAFLRLLARKLREWAARAQFLLAAAETRAALKAVKTRARQPRRAPTRRRDASQEEAENRGRPAG